MGVPPRTFSEMRQPLLHKKASQRSSHLLKSMKVSLMRRRLRERARISIEKRWSRGRKGKAATRRRRAEMSLLREKARMTKKKKKFLHPLRKDHPKMRN